jgi:hypothetical protein
MVRLRAMAAAVVEVYRAWRRVGWGGLPEELQRIHDVLQSELVELERQCVGATKVTIEGGRIVIGTETQKEEAR